MLAVGKHFTELFAHVFRRETEKNLFAVLTGDGIKYFYSAENAVIWKDKSGEYFVRLPSFETFHFLISIREISLIFNDRKEMLQQLSDNLVNGGNIDWKHVLSQDASLEMNSGAHCISDLPCLKKCTRRLMACILSEKFENTSCQTNVTRIVRNIVEDAFPNNQLVNEVLGPWIEMGGPITFQKEHCFSPVSVEDVTCHIFDADASCQPVLDGKQEKSIAKDTVVTHNASDEELEESSHHDSVSDIPSTLSTSGTGAAVCDEAANYLDSNLPEFVLHDFAGLLDDHELSLTVSQLSSPDHTVFGENVQSTNQNVSERTDSQHEEDEQVTITYEYVSRHGELPLPNCSKSKPFTDGSETSALEDSQLCEESRNVDPSENVEAQERQIGLTPRKRKRQTSVGEDLENVWFKHAQNHSSFTAFALSLGFGSDVDPWKKSFFQHLGEISIVSALRLNKTWDFYKNSDHLNFPFSLHGDTAVFQSNGLQLTYTFHTQKAILETIEADVHVEPDIGTRKLIFDHQKCHEQLGYLFWSWKLHCENFLSVTELQQWLNGCGNVEVMTANTLRGLSFFNIAVSQTQCAILRRSYEYRYGCGKRRKISPNELIKKQKL